MKERRIFSGDLKSARHGGQHSHYVQLRETLDVALSFAKAIADMALRQDVGRPCRIVFDLLSKLVDKDAQIFAFVTVLRSPYGNQKTIVGDRATCKLHQITQHRELFRSKANLLPHLFDPMTIRVK